MEIPRHHRWDVSFEEARRIQEEMRSRRRETGMPRRVRCIAGADVSHERGSDVFYAAVVLLDYPGLEVLDVATAVGRATFPYVPGYLVFREGPIVLEAMRGLSRRPDLIVFDGHGLAHPRRFGIACHLGVLLDLPSIGCGKTRLIGEHREPAARRGSRRSLVHDGEVVGTVLRTRGGVRPVYVSVGHRMRLAESCRILLAASRGYRIPEPTRQAHLAVNRLRRGEAPVPSLA